MVEFNQFVLISQRRIDKKERNRIAERMNYEGVGYNVETLVNCVVGQLTRSLVFIYKKFQAFIKLDRIGLNELNGWKQTELEHIDPNQAKVDRIDPKWMEWTKWMEIDQNGPKWTELVLRWLK